jgi:1-acyl-sn-glycerol-3-phosphate acyltransferase
VSSREPTHGTTVPIEHNLYRPFAILMNLIAWPLLILWTLTGILLSPLCYLGWKVVTGWDTGRITRHLIWVYGRVWLLIFSPFVQFRRDGFDNFQAPPGVMIVNHLSFFDTYCMGMLPVHDVNFVVRAWPFRKLFFYTAFMRNAGYLDIESNGWNDSAGVCQKVMDRNGWLLFFPEGHRSRDGQLQRFYSGAFRASIETGEPLVPLCITGTDMLMPPGRRWLQPARVRLRALDPVDPKGFTGETAHLEMRKYVKELMAKNIEEMRALDA